MQVSIIIPTHDNYDCLIKTINLLYYNLEKINNFKDFEILLIDNAADAKTKEFCAFAEKTFRNFRVITNAENLDFSRANNQAVKFARGEYILLLNDDIIPNKDWLLKMIKCSEEKGAGIVGSYQFNPENFKTVHAGVAFNEKHQPFHVLYGTEPFDPRTLITREVQAVTFSCVLITRKTWFDLDGLSEYDPDQECFYQFEDIDFCMRASVKGIKIVQCAEARVGHWVAQTSQKVFSQEHNKVYKHLPRFIDNWKFVAKPDREMFDKMPEGQPTILIGIPISERYEWCMPHLIHNLAQQNFYKGNIHICFAINNSGENFWEETLETAQTKLIPSGFAEVHLPRKVSVGGIKHNTIVDSRNFIRELGKELNVSHIMYWDCDVLMSPDAIERLFKLCTKENPISCGAVMYKSAEPNKPMLFTKKAEYDLQTYEEQMKEKTDLEVMEATKDWQYFNTGLGPFRFCPELMDGEVHEVGAAGMGCVMMTREVVDDISFEPNQKGFGSEDLWWFFKAGRKGYKIVCDTALRTYHFIKGGIYEWSVFTVQGDK